LSAGAKNAEIVALAARYEGVGEASIVAGEGSAAVRMSEFKSVAAE
jgi:hypothetical protein